MISSFGIISMAVMVVYYWLSWQIDSEEFSVSEMFRTFALLFGAVFTFSLNPPLDAIVVTSSNGTFAFYSVSSCIS